jgi:hypothetical protein
VPSLFVEISKGSDANPTPMPKLQASCCTPIMDGMEVKNMTSEKVQDMRKGVVEFLLDEPSARLSNLRPSRRMRFAELGI